MKFSPYLKVIAALMSLSSAYGFSATSDGYFIYEKNNNFNGDANGDLSIPSYDGLVFTNAITAGDNLAQNGQTLLLTDRENNQARSVFRELPIPLKNNYEFNTKFAFRIDHHKRPDDVVSHDGSPKSGATPRGADGLVFVIQTENNSAGSEGGGIGYYGIEDSIGIEFDTWGNTNSLGAVDESQYDIDVSTGLVDGNHIGLNLKGDPQSVELVAIDTPFGAQPLGKEGVVDTSAYNANWLSIRDASDGCNDCGNYVWLERVWWVWVDYNGKGETLEVRATWVYAGEPEPERPEEPIISKTNFILADQLGGKQDAFVGFTSATGGEVNSHEILFWEFGNTYNSDRDDKAPECGAPVTTDGQTISVQDDQTTENGVDLDEDGFIDYISGIEIIELLNADNLSLKDAPFNFQPTEKGPVDLTFSLIDGTQAGTATLSITDAKGNSCTQVINITGDDYPSAVAVVSSLDNPAAASNSIDAIVGENLQLDGSASSDKESDNLVFLWQELKHASIGDINSAISNVTFDAVGSYIVNLTVTDESGLEASANVNINIINQKPKASAQVQSDSMDAPANSASIALGNSLNFLSEGSSDHEDDIAGIDLNFDWEVINANGEIVNNSSGKNSSYFFDEPGTFTVTLTVTDSEGATDKATATVEVYEEFPPVAQISLVAKNQNGKELNNRSDQATQYEFKINQDEYITLELSGQNSSDKDGNIIDFSWSGDFLSSGQETSFESNSLSEEKNYTFILTVTDNDDYSAQASIQVKVVINQAPKPDLGSVIDIPEGSNVTIDPDSDSVIMQEKHAIRFDASNSFDPDALEGDELNYEWWTADENGNPIELVSTTELYEHTASAGSEQLILKLIDAEGATSNTTFTIKSFEPNYQASGTVSFGFSILLSIFSFIRRYKNT